MKNNKRKEEKLEKNDLPSILKINHSRTKLEWKIQNSDQYAEKRNQKAMFYCMIHALCTKKAAHCEHRFPGLGGGRNKPFVQ